MSDFRDLYDELMENEEFKKTYEDRASARLISDAILAARIKQNITQEELAKRASINRSDISKIENADANPTLKTLNKLAKALGAKLNISFEYPKEANVQNKTTSYLYKLNICVQEHSTLEWNLKNFPRESSKGKRSYHYLLQHEEPELTSVVSGGY